MQADVIFKEPPPWVPPFSLSGGGARVEGGGGRGTPSDAPEWIASDTNICGLESIRTTTQLFSACVLVK